MKVRITAVVDVGDTYDDREEFWNISEALEAAADAAGDVLDQIGSVSHVRATRPRPARDAPSSAPRSVARR